jgi:Fur family peroxide stress response transcriptional regulator
MGVKLVSGPNLVAGEHVVSDQDTRLKELVAKLKEGNHRLTPQRLAVLRILAASEGHPSVEQIYERLKPDFPTTSLATVYKTVTLLKEMGEVLELSFNDGGNRYDGSNPFPHPHLICTRCGAIEDLELDALSDVPHQVVCDTGYQVLSHRLDFFGICPRCQAEAR